MFDEHNTTIKSFTEVINEIALKLMSENPDRILTLSDAKDMVLSFIKK